MSSKPAATRVCLRFCRSYLVWRHGRPLSTPSLYGPHGIDATCTVPRRRSPTATSSKGIKAHAEIGGFCPLGHPRPFVWLKRIFCAELPAAPHPLRLYSGPCRRAGVKGRVLDPDRILPDILDLLEPGYILAHPLTRHPGGFVGQDGRGPPDGAARRSPAASKIDVGYGSHFSFAMAKKVLDAGILPVHARRRHARLQYQNACRKGA